MTTKGLNRATLIGYLGAIPELNITHNGGREVKRAVGRLATDDSFTKADGTVQKDTDWHDLVFWGDNAEAISKHPSTKIPIYVEGKLKNRTYQKNGNTFYGSEIKVDNFLVANTANESANAQGSQESMKNLSSSTDSGYQSTQQSSDPYNGIKQPARVEVNSETTANMDEPPFN